MVTRSSHSISMWPPHSPTRITKKSILKLAGAFHWPKTSRMRFWAFSYSMGEPCGRSNQLSTYFMGNPDGGGKLLDLSRAQGNNAPGKSHVGATGSRRSGVTCHLPGGASRKMQPAAGRVESRGRGGQLIGAQPCVVIVDLRRDHELVRAGASDECLQAALHRRRGAHHRAGQHLVEQTPVAREQPLDH